MAFIRLYTGDDGQTHIEEMELESAPTRQYIITLSGAAEIGLKDGTIYRLGAGDVNLAEDLSGGGHTTRVVSDESRVTATIHLED